jgi:hypothetical protein
MSLPPLFSGVVYLEKLDNGLPELAKSIEPDSSEIKLPEINNSLSSTITSGIAGVLAPITNVLGTALPYASTAFRVVNLIGSFFGDKPKENSIPDLPYGKDFGLIEYNMHGKDYKFRSDLVISEEHKRTAQLCTHPIEDGTEIADHILMSPKTITAVLLLTNFSIQRADASFVKNHSEDAYMILEKAQEEKSICNFQSSVKKYRDYAIEELSFTRDAETGNAMKIYIMFKEITIAKNSTVVVDVLVSVSKDKINMSILGGTANTGIASIGGF